MRRSDEQSGDSEAIALLIRQEQANVKLYIEIVFISLLGELILKKRKIKIMEINFMPKIKKRLTNNYCRETSLVQQHESFNKHSVYECIKIIFIHS